MTDVLRKRSELLNSEPIRQNRHQETNAVDGLGALILGAAMPNAKESEGLESNKDSRSVDVEGELECKPHASSKTENQLDAESGGQRDVEKDSALGVEKDITLDVEKGNNVDGANEHSDENSSAASEQESQSQVLIKKEKGV